MQKDYQLFRRTTPVWARLLVASVCAIMLMVADGSDKRLNPVHVVISTVTSPIQNALHASYQWFADMFVHTYSIQKLALENETLKAEQAASGARLTQLEQIEKDNSALRAELTLQQSQKAGAMAAQVLYQVVDPYARKLVLDKGSNVGVIAGQPVITADGLLGQITSVAPLTSELTLVLDTKINVPVQVVRSPEVRGFLSGKKEEGYLEVRFFSAQADLQVEDILVTSGLDGLYPEGLPVARVSKIDTGEMGQSEITVVPTTKGMSVRYVTILQIADSKAGLARNAAQAEAVVADKLPTTLGARTREQIRAKENK